MLLTCDVIIVGAGPAGSMAAKTLSKNGFSTILIDKSRNIGSKVQCAEAVNHFIFQDTEVNKNDLFIKNSIDETIIMSNSEVFKLTSQKWRGYIINRKVFDNYLAEEAQNSEHRAARNPLCQER